MFEHFILMIVNFISDMPYTGILALLLFLCNGFGLIAASMDHKNLLLAFTIIAAIFIYLGPLIGFFSIFTRPRDAYSNYDERFRALAAMIHNASYMEMSSPRVEMLLGLMRYWQLVVASSSSPSLSAYNVGGGGGGQFMMVSQMSPTQQSAQSIMYQADPRQQTAQQASPQQQQMPYPLPHPQGYSLMAGANQAATTSADITRAKQISRPNY